MPDDDGKDDVGVLVLDEVLYLNVRQLVVYPDDEHDDEDEDGDMPQFAVWRADGASADGYPSLSFSSIVAAPMCLYGDDTSVPPIPTEFPEGSRMESWAGEV